MCKAGKHQANCARQDRKYLLYQHLNSWRREQSPANQSPPVCSLFHGKIQGNSPALGAQMVKAPRLSVEIQSITNRIPYPPKQGKFAGDPGKPRRITANLMRRPAPYRLRPCVRPVSRRSRPVADNLYAVAPRQRPNTKAPNVLRGVGLAHLSKNLLTRAWRALDARRKKARTCRPFGKGRSRRRWWPQSNGQSLA